jgi:hypothetical protein
MTFRDNIPLRMFVLKWGTVLLVWAVAITVIVLLSK